MVIGFRVTTVDNKHLGVGHDTTLPFFNRGMAIDNMTTVRIKIELNQNVLAEFFIFTQVKVGIFFFVVRFLIFDEIALKGGHFLFTK